MKVAIDGQRVVGLYRVDCECGGTWRGDAERSTPNHFSPALPVAEAVAHMRMCHPEELLDVRFSEKFSEWLVSHWEYVSFQTARELALPFPQELTVGRH
jgi:hypothetical protein